MILPRIFPHPCHHAEHRSEHDAPHSRRFTTGTFDLCCEAPTRDKRFQVVMQPNLERAVARSYAIGAMSLPPLVQRLPACGMGQLALKSSQLGVCLRRRYPSVFESFHQRLQPVDLSPRQGLSLRRGWPALSRQYGLLTGELPHNRLQLSDALLNSRLNLQRSGLAILELLLAPRGDSLLPLDVLLLLRRDIP